MVEKREKEAVEALASPNDINELHREIESLGKSLLEAQDKAEENWQRLLRKEAELQNIQRRMQQEIDNTRKFAIERFASEILEVVDSLEQGINFKDAPEGMKLTYSLLLSVLAKEHITPIEPKLGEVFNPSFHEAMAMQPTAEFEPNKIVTVIQKGYMLNDRLLRPARVIVAKAP